MFQMKFKVNFDEILQTSEYDTVVISLSVYCDTFWTVPTETKVYNHIFSALKGIVHTKMNICWKCADTQSIQD